jgi:hypothetical protein
MSMPPPLRDQLYDQFVVSYGKSAAVGVFTAEDPLPLARGARVLLKTPRGLEAGTVRCPATIRQARLLGETTSGMLLRALSPSDEADARIRTALADALCDAGRSLVVERSWNFDILDAEVLFDGSQAILQFLGSDEGIDDCAHELEATFGIAIRFENLAAPTEPPHDEAEHGGCGKPDCGSESGGGCSSEGGGCSSCGSKNVDLRDYFAHLRGKMETDRRVPLL